MAALSQGALLATQQQGHPMHMDAYRLNKLKYLPAMIV